MISSTILYIYLLGIYKANIVSVPSDDFYLFLKTNELKIKRERERGEEEWERNKNKHWYL